MPKTISTVTMELLVIRSTKSISGTETYNINLLRELNKNPSIEVKFLTNLDIFARELRKNGTQTHICHWFPVEVGTKKQLLRVLFYVPIFIPRYIARIRKLESGKRFDLICLQSRTEMIFLSPVLKLLGYKVVWIQHGPFFKSQASKIIKFLYLLASKLVNKVIVPSEDTKLDLFRGGVEKKRIVVVHIGLGVKTFAPYTTIEKERRGKELELPINADVIGFLGTITMEKGITDFIKVAETLGTKHYKFIVIGDGPDKKIMQKNIKATFTGFVFDVGKYLKQVDILLFPTHHFEATSIAILEAQAMGIPVLAYDKGGTREIITHGYNGFLYKEGDIEGMVRDIRMLNKNRKLLREMGKHARQRIVEKFNIEKQAKLFAEFFKNV